MGSVRMRILLGNRFFQCLNHDGNPLNVENGIISGPEEGLKIRGASSNVVGIISSPPHPSPVEIGFYQNGFELFEGLNKPNLNVHYFHSIASNCSMLPCRIFFYESDISYWPEYKWHKLKGKDVNVFHLKFMVLTLKIVKIKTVGAFLDLPAN